MEAKHTPENKLFNYLCEIGPPLIDTEVHEIRLIVYEELGLKDLTPEQIEELKVWLKAESTTLMFDYVAKNRLLEAELQELKHQFEVEYREWGFYQNEITKLQAQLEEYKIMESFNKSSSHQIRMLMAENLKLKDDLDNKDVEVLNYGMDVVPALKKEIAELKQAKADAWDEGRDSTFRSDTPNPENPYKE